MRFSVHGLFGLVILTTACPVTNQAEADIQSAINQIDADSASWQAFLEELERKLIADEQGALANQVSQLIQNTIAVAGAEVRCDVDFVAKEITNTLLRMLHTLDAAIVAPPLMPAICQVVPSSVDMNDPPAVINFYGYNFDTGGANLTVAFNHDGVADNATSYLSVASSYLATLNVSRTSGLPVCNKSNRTIVLQSAGQPISTIGFVAATCPSGSWRPGPPQRLLQNPVDFPLAGGLFGSRADFNAGSACSPGYVRVDPPQISKLSVDGDCGIAWASDDPEDCTVKVHEGVAAFQGVECLVTIHETGKPIWVPPPPCTCQ